MFSAFSPYPSVNIFVETASRFPKTARMPESEPFPAGDSAAELCPGEDKTVKLDPISAEVSTSLELKEQLEAADRERAETKRRDALQTLKNTIIISGIIVAVAGAVFAFTKKMKEKQ